ncbi:Y-family DNA polymerase [Desulfovibrio psychrotolerans]|uniref:UmuC protein n=1 Tax=Desulfovibrio psychrotolerans TaxID=415242 RepID=A0A7J0BVX7_9BACT|nr:Y-family DNA polymerase [Desulfovibrio psychrotolerans]GFM37870.1 umuC protein [Desulfovibrio psychrotolerans]
MAAVFALVDCNNFYCSCERVFRPDLEARPVVVLSNNDGCIIARSAEAKKLGIGMGEPYHKLKGALLRQGVTVFSSNYALYGDLSARVMRVLEMFSPMVEVYSIDEAFLRLEGVAGQKRTEHARRMRQQVRQWTGIPVSVGMGPTRTLAKLASRVCKSIPACDGVFDLTRYAGDAAAMNRILDTVAAGDVWGVGRRYAAMLERHGVLTARQLRDMPDDWVRRRMTVVGLRTVLELRGISCVEPEDVQPRRSILSSRSFGTPVKLRAHAHEALTAHITRAAEKLRREGLVAHTAGVMIRAYDSLAAIARTADEDAGGEDRPYADFATRHLVRATDYTPHLLQAGRELLDAVFREGLRYKKVGVLLTGLEGRHAGQHSLLDCMTGESARDKTRDALMRTADSINARHGRGTLRYAAEGADEKAPWHMRQRFRSPGYTTAWKELARVRG